MAAVSNAGKVLEAHKDYLPSRTEKLFQFKYSSHGEGGKSGLKVESVQLSFRDTFSYAWARTGLNH